MRVTLVDPSAFTPPYDRALAAAIARQGVEVELLTSRFLYGPVPDPEGYRVEEAFYRRTTARGLEAPGRIAFKAIEHIRDMRRLPGELVDTDVVHYQWLTVPGVDRFLLPSKRPRVMTAHYIPAGGRPLVETGKVLRKMDGVVAHSRKGADRLAGEGGVPADRIRVIPHGALDYLTMLPDEAPLPPELEGAEGPVVLFFGLIRPYKGLDLLIEAMCRVPGAELWVVGNPRVPEAEIERLKEWAEEIPGGSRWATRFVEDREIPEVMRRADIVVLPYREAEQSGVLYTGLAFGKAVIASDVGGFGEVAEDHDAIRLVPPGDVGALVAAITDLVEHPEERAALGERALEAARGHYSWDSVARRTVEFYRELLG